MIYFRHRCDKGAHKNYRLLVFFFYSATVTLAVISWHFQTCLGIGEEVFLVLRQTRVTQQNWEAKKWCIFYSWNLSDYSVNWLPACYYLMLAYNEAKLADPCFFHTDRVQGRTSAVCDMGRQGSMETGKVERDRKFRVFQLRFSVHTCDWSLEWLKVGSNNRLSLLSLPQTE